MKSTKVILNFDQESTSIELPLVKSTMGNDAIDIRQLGTHQVFSYDPGFMSTASCSSGITFIDGEKGLLLYRGYPIEQLAEHYDFLDVAYLLMHGELPEPQEKDTFSTTINRHTMLHDQLNNIFRGFRRDAHPMAVMVGVVGSMSAFYFDSMDVMNPEHRQISAHQLLAKVPTIASWSYKYSLGQPFIYPKNDLGYAENFMRMMFATLS